MALNMQYNRRNLESGEAYNCGPLAFRILPLLAKNQGPTI